MDLSPEDALRLNVLLANKPLAIRINESAMVVSGLTDTGEARVELRPNCRDEQYIKKVKELISGHVLGSPGGYPVYLQRWTRMGQMKDDSLEQLLMLGEPEAVVAAVCAPGLTDELARRAPYYVGFVTTLPDDIPETQAPHPLWETHHAALEALAGRGNAVAAGLARVLSGPGQAWLHTLYRIFKKPSNQDVVNITLDQMAAYFSALRETPADATLEALDAEAGDWLEGDAAAREVLALDDTLRGPLLSMRVISGMGYGVVRPVFKGTTAIGSLMRRKLEPVMGPLLGHLDALTARPPRR